MLCLRYRELLERTFKQPHNMRRFFLEGMLYRRKRGCNLITKEFFAGSRMFVRVDFGFRRRCMCVMLLVVAVGFL